MSEPTTAGRWTTEPPTAPGWYWWRFGNDVKPLWVFGGVYTGKTYGEWWTIPIQEPRS